MIHVLEFIRQLEQNNRRDWFEQNRSTYETVRYEFEQLIAKLLPELISLDPALATLTIKDCIFRIYRDTRFSKDKRPYKNHFGAYMAEGGRKSIKAGYYLHIQPGGKSMLAGGMYMPPAEYLKKIRQEIDYNAQELHQLLNQPGFKKYYGSLSGDTLKTTPRDYPADHPDIDLLRMKEYTALHFVSDERITSPDFAAYAIEAFRALKPLNDFLNAAIE